MTSVTPVRTPKKRRLLSKRRVRVIVPVVAAVITATGTFFAGRASTTSSLVSAAAAQQSPSVAISNLSDGDHIPMVLTVRGTVSNLRPDEAVFVYNETVSDGTPSGTFYPGLGPCPVGAHGVWVCSVYVGSPKNYGYQFYVWAAVVTSAQAYTDNQHATETGLSSIGYVGDLAPPYIGGSPSIYKVLVVRCLKDEACAAA